MKESYKKLKYNTFFYFLIFAVIILVVVWLFQVLFLERFYSVEKRDVVISQGEKMCDVLNSEEDLRNFSDMATASKEQGINTYIFEPKYDVLGNIESLVLAYPDSMLISSDVIDERVYITLITSLGNKKQNCKMINGEGICYVAKLEGVLSGEFLVLKYSTESIKDAISAIQLQLSTVAGVVIIIAFILAVVLSNKLTKPITDMATTAKKWANGESNVKFDTGNYTELAELGLALNYAKEGIDKTENLQRDLIANVSHDLKTPLTMIKAYAEMIRDIYGDNKQKRDECTGVIVDEADRLTNLVNDILDLSKLQSGTVSLSLKQVNISELIELVIYRFNNYVEVDGYNIITEIEPDLFTEVDEERISQVIYNLLGNSLSYTGEDKTVKVYLYRKDDKIVLEIIDSGKGIDKEQIDTIWEKYYRFSDTHKRSKGTGLGLSIVKTILDAHKLRYGVISKKGKGSNFFVEFKVIEDER